MKDFNNLGYLGLQPSERAREFGFNILTFMILFNSFIPIR